MSDASISSKSDWQDAIAFASKMWLFSRMVIWLAMLGLAPLLPPVDGGEVATLSWDVFVRWDSHLYQNIVTNGYAFRNDGKGYNIAFFPFYPLVTWIVMQTGLSFAIAATLINSIAFWGALVILYRWVAQQHGRSPARWATAALAWCPFSLFGSVAYTEGVFLLFSTLALWQFDRKRYGWAALWGSVTTAIRPPGVALIPAFALTAWQENRGIRAYVAAIASAGGILAYMLYCAWRFGEPLAFLLTQRGWQSPQDFHGEAWVTLLMVVVFGPANEDERELVDPGYPLALLVILAIALFLWQRRDRLGRRADYGFGVLIVLLWLVGGSPLINLVVVFGGLYLVWKLRQELSRVALNYALISWAIIFSVGRTTSAERYAYGIVPLAIALGILFDRFPKWGRFTLGFFAILLVSLSVRFAQGLWAG